MNLVLQTPREADTLPKVINLFQRILNLAESSSPDHGLKFNLADVGTTSFFGNPESIILHPTYRIMVARQKDQGKEARAPPASMLTETAIVITDLDCMF